MDLNFKNNSLKIGSDGNLSTSEQSHIEVCRETTQSIPNTGFHDVIFDIKVFDLLDEYDISTGIFTPKKDGLYICAWGALANLTSWSVGEVFLASLCKNDLIADGNCFYGTRFEFQSSISQYGHSIGCTTISLIVGDNLRIKASQNSSSTITLGPYGDYNFFHILRIG